jgi:hypothetical protein
MRRSIGTVVVALALALLAAGCSNKAEDEASEYSPSPGAAAVTGSLVAADQTSDGMTAKVGSVTINGKDGFIAWHIDNNGSFGAVVGHSGLVKQGTTKDVEVKMDQKVATGDYWPMLHEDSNANGTYDFPNGDPPVKGGNDIVMKKIHVTVT